MSKEEKIIELRKDINKLKELLQMMKKDFTSGYPSSLGLPSTLSFLSITFDYRSTFSPSICSWNLTQKVSADIAIPVVKKELTKLTLKLVNLENPWYVRLFGKAIISTSPVGGKIM
jgi:hypothetical protein